MGGSKSKPEQPPEPTPWREISWLPNMYAWSRQTENKLQETCLNGQNSLKILMFGPTQNGKSSLVNSMIGAMNKKIMQCCIASKSESSITRSLYSPDVRVNGEPLRFKLTDMPGFFQGMMYAEDYLKAVLGGHIKEDAVIPEGPLDKTAEYYAEKPTREDLPCCVVLVMRAGRPLTEDVQRKFILVVRVAESYRLKVAIVLTHVDNLQGEKNRKLTGRNVSSVFHDQAVYQACLQASNDTGIPLSFIHPVVNYTHQVETNTEMNILQLFTLSKILELAEDGAYSRRR